jgi:hypothetical protein
VTQEERQSLMREAINDEMFVNDLKEVMNDFAHADFDEIRSLDEMSADSQREAAMILWAIRDRTLPLEVSMKDLIEEGRYR